MSGEAASYESARGLAPDLSPARCARRLVTRGFAARATSFITTKIRRSCHIFYNNENESLLAGYELASPFRLKMLTKRALPISAYSASPTPPNKEPLLVITEYGKDGLEDLENRSGSLLTFQEEIFM